MSLFVDRSRPRQTRKPLPKEQIDLKSSQKADLLKSPKSDGGKKPDLRARYWKFLFDNLQRAVDAIYETCEQDESALECRVRTLDSLSILVYSILSIHSIFHSVSNTVKRTDLFSSQKLIHM